MFTLRMWFNKYFEVYKPDLKPHTLKDYLALIRLYIPVQMLDTPLANIKAYDIQPVIRAVEANRQRTILYQLMHSAFTFALGNGLVPFNPMLAVINRKGESKRRRPITEEEENRILAKVISDNFKVYIVFCIETGVRPGEALTVDPDRDIDYENNRIKIHGTKTKNAVRYVPISVRLENALRDFSPMSPHRLFTYSVSYVSHKFKEISRRAGIEDICEYCLRHTFATRCTERGVPDYVVQCWLGHADKSTTLNVYTDFTEIMHEEGLQFINKQSNSIIIGMKKAR